MVGQTNPDKNRQLPPRGDDVGQWAAQHIRAAQLRARGRGWASVSEELGYRAATVRQYVLIPGFEELVTHFQRELFEDEVKRFFYEGSIEAVEALRQQFLAAAHEVAELEDATDGTTGILRNALESRTFTRSKAAVYAADKYLDAIGFKKFRQRVAELEAEVSVQGSPGQTLRHEGGDSPVRVSHDEPFDAESAAAIYEVLRDCGAVGSLPADDDSEAE